MAREHLTADAVEALARYFLPEAALRTLRSDGSVRIEWPTLAELPNSRFTIVAARRGHDIWIEVRHVQARGAAENQTKLPAAPRRSAEARTRHGRTRRHTVSQPTTMG